jgi:hypothetical protein
VYTESVHWTKIQKKTMSLLYTVENGFKSAFSCDTFTRLDSHCLIITQSELKNEDVLLLVGETRRYLFLNYLI